jgi:putative ABC transport system ATP-binding protein
MGIFQRLNDEGKTVILVTHEADVAQYAKRRIIFRDGQVIEDALVLDRRSGAASAMTQASTNTNTAQSAQSAPLP